MIKVGLFERLYLFIYFLGANKMEHSLTDGEEQHGSIKFLNITHEKCSPEVIFNDK